MMKQMSIVSTAMSYTWKKPAATAYAKISVICKSDNDRKRHDGKQCARAR